MTDFTLRQLETFVAAAEQDSFTRAADLLHLTQSTVSAHIRSLERTLGTPVLVRRGQVGVSLTDEGLSLYPLAKKILSGCQALTAAAGSLSSAPELPLSLGASTIPGQYLLPELMAAFMVEHPSCRYELRRGDSREVHQMLLAGRIRMGFVGARTEAEALLYVPLARDELVLVTPNTPRYQLLQHRGTWGRELLGEPTVAREEGSGTDRTVHQYMGRTGFPEEKLHIVARLDDSETIKRMVAQGAGVSVLSALSVQKELADGSVLIFPMDPVGLRRIIYLVRRRDIHYSAMEKQFIAFVQAHGESVTGAET